MNCEFATVSIFSHAAIASLNNLEMMVYHYVIKNRDKVMYMTIRDAAESHFKMGDVLRVGRYEDDGYFCTIRVVATSTVTLDTLTELHAQQENMTLAQLREVIAEIYPEEKQFYVIEFEKL